MKQKRFWTQKIENETQSDEQLLKEIAEQTKVTFEEILWRNIMVNLDSNN